MPRCSALDAKSAPDLSPHREVLVYDSLWRRCASFMCANGSDSNRVNGITLYPAMRDGRAIVHLLRNVLLPRSGTGLTEALLPAHCVFFCKACHSPKPFRVLARLVQCNCSEELLPIVTDASNNTGQTFIRGQLGHYVAPLPFCTLSDLSIVTKFRGDASYLTYPHTEPVEGMRHLVNLAQRRRTALWKDEYVGSPHSLRPARVCFLRQSIAAHTISDPAQLRLDRVSQRKPDLRKRIQGRRVTTALWRGQVDHRRKFWKDRLPRTPDWFLPREMLRRPQALGSEVVPPQLLASLEPPCVAKLQPPNPRILYLSNEMPSRSTTSCRACGAVPP